MKQFRLTVTGGDDPVLLELHDEWEPMIRVAVESGDVHQQSEILKKLFDAYIQRSKTTRRPGAAAKWQETAFRLAELHSRLTREGPITAIEEVVGDDGTK